MMGARRRYFLRRSDRPRRKRRRGPRPQRSTEVAVPLHVVPLGGPTHSLRLKDGVIAVPALSSHVRPALVLAERETRELLAAAARDDVGAGGVFSAGPAGIQ